MSAIKNQASITLDHEEHEALKAVVQYLIENERTSYEECEGDMGKLRNHIWWKARILLHALNT
jgi:hypothetical protein